MECLLSYSFQNNKSIKKGKKNELWVSFRSNCFAGEKRIKLVFKIKSKVLKKLIFSINSIDFEFKYQKGSITLLQKYKPKLLNTNNDPTWYWEKDKN